MADSNLLLLEEAAAKLRGLLDELVFVGGATLSLLITDPGAAPARATVDVDVIARIATYSESRTLPYAAGFMAALRWMQCRLRIFSDSATGGTAALSRLRGEWRFPAAGRFARLPLPIFSAPRSRHSETEANGTSMPATIWKILPPSSMAANRFARKSPPRLPIYATIWPMRQGNCCKKRIFAMRFRVTSCPIQQASNASATCSGNSRISIAADKTAPRSAGPGRWPRPGPAPPGRRAA